MVTSVQNVRDVLTLEWPRNPFPGLRPFRKDEAVIFYGRNSHKDEVLTRLNHSQMVFVTGASGCGKSSLIKAGVLPALHAGLLSRAGYHWETLQMRPGRRPLVNLAAAFKSIQSDTADTSYRELDGIIESEGSALWLAANAFAPVQESTPSQRRPVRLLLLIDQFEEIFGEQIQDRSDVERLVRLLVRFAEQPHPNLFIVITMRSDYVGQCANFEGLAEIINRTQFLTPVLTHDELIQAIARPAEDYNGDVEPRLVDEIMRDMRTGTEYQPDSLPLMQHALLWMWTNACTKNADGEPPRPPFDDAAERARLTLQTYQDHGGIGGILDRHAEDVLREAVGDSARRKAIAESVFRRLTERDIEGRYRRSPATRELLCSVAGCTPEELSEIIRPFEHPDVCFLEQRPSDGADEILVDISHESLIRQWNTAKTWVDAEADKVRKFRDLAHAAANWDNGGRSPDFLKRRGELEVNNKWWEEEAPSEDWARRYSGIHGGSLAQEFRRVEEYLRVSSETDRAEQDEIERVRIARLNERSRKRQRVWFAATGVFLVLMCFIWVGSLVLQNIKTVKAEAEAARSKDQADRTKEQAERSLADRVRLTAFLVEQGYENYGPTRALAAMIESVDDSLPFVPEIQRIGYRALADLREQRILGDRGWPVQSVQFAPHHPVLTITSQSGRIQFWRRETGELIDELPYPGRFLTARWTPDGRELFVSAREQNSFFVMPCSHEKLRFLFSGCGPDRKDVTRPFGEDIGVGTFSPDGRWLVTGGANLNTKLWNVASLENVRGFGLTKSWSINAAFSGDSQRIAVGGDAGQIRIFSIPKVTNRADEQAHRYPEIVRALPAETQSSAAQPSISQETPTQGGVLVASLAFHPSNSDALLVTFQDGRIHLWSSIKDDRHISLASTRGTPSFGVFNHDGNWAATAHGDGKVRLWPLRSVWQRGTADPTPQILRGHESWVSSVAYSPDGEWIATGSIDGTARIWRQRSALGRLPINVTAPADDPMISITKEGGRLILKDKNDKTFSLKGPKGFDGAARAAISPSGTDAVVAPSQGRPFLFNLAAGELIVALPGPPADWRHVAFLDGEKCKELPAPACILGTTQGGEAYIWPYLPDLPALKEFAATQLPFEGAGQKRFQTRDYIACRIKAKPEAECPAQPDPPAQD